MDFLLSNEEAAIFEDVRCFIEKEVTPELVEETYKNEMVYGGPESRKFVKKLAAKGWLTPDWPRELGGIGASEQLAFMIHIQLMYAGAPTHYTAAKMAGPCIRRVGSEEMKKRFLPIAASGEVEFALGYTEAEAGSDLMSLKMRAEDKGDYFLVNGQKIFNTAAHLADYHWLGVRTEPDKKGASGISLMVVDLKSPGITVSPIITRLGSRTNEVSYEDVKVPKENLVGERGKGAYYIMQALDHERSWPFGSYKKMLEEIVDYAKTKIVRGRPLSKDPLVRQKIATMAADLEVTMLLYYRIACLLDQKKSPGIEAAMQKLFVTENASQKLTESIMQILGHFGPLERNSKWVQIKGKLPHLYQVSYVETIVAGTSEIQRNILAQRGLGLPRA